MGMQAPGDETRLHDRHAPPQALLQQTPLPLTMSAQNVDAHSLPAEHTAPFIFKPHVPPTHFTPVTQSASLVQLSKHWFVARLQEWGAQTTVAPSLHEP